MLLRNLGCHNVFSAFYAYLLLENSFSTQMKLRNRRRRITHGVPTILDGYYEQDGQAVSIAFYLIVHFYFIVCSVVDFFHYKKSINRSNSRTRRIVPI